MSLGRRTKPHFGMLTKLSCNISMLKLIALTMIILHRPIQPNRLHTQPTVETNSTATVFDILHLTRDARISVGTDAVLAVDVRSAEEVVNVYAIVDVFGNILGALVAGSAVGALEIAFVELGFVVLAVEADESFGAVAFLGEVVFIIDAPAAIYTEPPTPHKIKIRIMTTTKIPLHRLNLTRPPRKHLSTILRIIMIILRTPTMIPRIIL